jgi:Protein of unknown function (DUF3102)
VLRPLDELAAELRREHAECEGAWRRTVEHAVNCGLLLIEAKQQVPRGSWLPWLEQNFAGATRTAQAYMRLARNAHDVAHSPTVHDAMTLLAKHRMAYLGSGPQAGSSPKAEDTLAQLGWSEGAAEELEAMSSPEPEPPAWAGFRRSGIWRTSMNNIASSIRKAERELEAAREARGVFPEVVEEMLTESARALEEAAAEAHELAAHIVKGRRR